MKPMYVEWSDLGAELIDCGNGLMFDSHLYSVLAYLWAVVVHRDMSVDTHVFGWDVTAIVIDRE
jgi:hypothetical protein